MLQSEQQHNKKLHWVVLIAIFISAVGVRVWGNDFGLPYTYHQDDARNVERSLRLLEGTLSYDVNPGWNILMSLAFAGEYGVERLQDATLSLDEFVASARLDPTRVEKIGRSLSGLLGTTTVLMVFLIGKRAYNKETGLVAAAFLAFSFLHVRDSHYAVADVPATFWIATTLYFALLAYQTPNHCNYLLAGLLGGFASATKWTSLVLVLPLVLTRLLTYREFHWRGLLNILRDRFLWLAAGGFILGFLMLSPQLLVNPWRLVWEGMRIQAGVNFGGLYVDTVPGWIFYIKTLAWGMGIPLLIVNGAGVGWAFYRRQVMDWLLLAFPVVYYALMGITLHYFARYALPLIPFLALFGARALVDWAEFSLSQQSQRSRQWLLAVATLLLIAPPARSSILHNQLLTRTDTRTLAGDWFEAHVPAGATVAAELHTPFFRDQVGPGGPRLPRRGEERYTIIEIGWPSEAHYELTRYIELGVNYIVTSSFITNLRFVDDSRTATRQIFYRNLAEQAELVAEFRPYESDTSPPQAWDQMYGPAIALEQFSRPGPVIRIYRLTP